MSASAADVKLQEQKKTPGPSCLAIFVVLGGFLGKEVTLVHNRKSWRDIAHRKTSITRGKPHSYSLDLRLLNGVFNVVA
jgi:hypothetical protein